MRRWLTALAMSLVAAGAASAQPQGFTDEDVAPPEYHAPVTVREISDVCDPDECVDPEAARWEAWMMNRAAALNLGPGQNMDASCYDEASRAKHSLSWADMFTPKLEVTAPDESASRIPLHLHFLPCPPYVDMLNALCFLDALSPAKIGPDIGPWIDTRPSELIPGPFNGGFYIGFFR